MPDLPPIEQDFTANVDPYVAEIQKAIDITNDLKNSVNDAITKILELQTEIASLQGKTITVDVEVNMPKNIISPTISGPTLEGSGISQAVQQIEESFGGAAGALSDFANKINSAVSGLDKVGEAAKGAEQGQAGLETQTKTITEALGNETEAAQKVGEALWSKASAAQKAKDAQKTLEEQTKLNMEAILNEAEALNRLHDLMASEAEAHYVNDLVDLHDHLDGTATAIERVEAALFNLHRIEGEPANISNWTAIVAQAMNANTAMRNLSVAVRDAETAFLALGRLGGPMRGLLAVQPIIDFISRWHYLAFAIGEITAVLLPAAVAFGTFAAAASPSIEHIIDRMGAINTVVHATGQSIYPLTGAFNQLAAALRPDVYSIFGDALTVINSRMGEFSIIAKGAGDVLQQLAARAASAMLSSGFSEFLHNASRDLMLFGTFLGNIFGILGNVIRALPGLAAPALAALNNITHVIESLTASPIIRWVMNLALAFHGLFMYTTTTVLVMGLLAVTLFRLSAMVIDAYNAVVLFAREMALLLAMNPELWVALAAAAFVVLIIAMGHAKTAQQNWLAGQEQLISSSKTLGGVLSTTASAVSTSYDRMKAAQTSFALQQAQVAQQTHGLGVAMGQAADHTGAAATAVTRAGAAYQQWSAVHTQLVDQMKLEQFRVMELSGTKGVGGLAMAMGILNAAGVKVSDVAMANHQNWLLDLQAVNGLIKGYEAMGQRAGVLGNDLNILTIQTGIQDSKVQALNQAWDAFIQLSTGLQTSFITLEQGLQTMGQSALTSRTHIGTLTGELQNLSLKAGVSLNGINAKSLAMRSAFQQSIGNAQQLFDAIRVGAAAGAVSQGQLAKSVASTLAQMLPFAKGSQYAVAQLSALAQEAGGPATQSYSTLKKWVDANAVSGDKFNGMIDRMTARLTNVTTVAKQFATTMQADVIAALAQGAAPTQQLTQLSENLRNQLAKYPGTSSQVQNAAKALDTVLFRLGFTQTEVKQLNQEMSGQNLVSAGTLKKLQQQAQSTESQLSKWPTTEHTDITVHGTGLYTITGSAILKSQGKGGSGSAAGGLAAGGLVSGPGSATSDSIPARLSHGEYVVQAAAVAKYGKGMMDAINARHFASGGSVNVTETGQTMPQLVSGAFNFLNSFNNQFDMAMVSAIKSADKTAAAAAARAMAFTGGKPGYGSSSAAMAFAQMMLRNMGWGQYWPDLYRLWNQESGWNPYAVNPTSGAYGIPQSLGHGHPYNLGDYANQIRWGLAYISGRYGNPANAWAHEMCVPLSSMILTRTGWKSVDQIVHGDETLGYNSVTGMNEWTPITQVHIYSNAPLIQLTNKTWSAMCTPAHRWVARHWKHTGRKLVNGRTKNQYNLEDVFVETQKITSRHSLRLAAEADTGAGPPISLQEAELLGWVLGDGWIIHPKSRTPDSTHWRTLRGVQPYICLGQSKPQGVKAITQLIHGLPFSQSVRAIKKPSGESGLPLTTWSFYRDFSAELLKRSGYDHRNPVPFVISMSSEQREAFMRGVFGAEGTQSAPSSIKGSGLYSGNKSYPQNDGPKQEAIILGIYLSGKRPGISELNSRGTVIGKYVSNKPAAVSRETKPFIGGEKIHREDAGRGAVYCVTTDLGSWTVRQGRQVFLTGNSAGWYDQGGYLPPGLSLALNTTGSPEPVGHPGVIQNHITVTLDGKQIWQAVQQQNLKYQVRNSGLSRGAAQGGGLSPVQGQTIIKNTLGHLSRGG